MPSLSVQCLPLGEYQVNCYLVENPETRQLFIVDPGADGGAIIRAVGNRQPVAVLLTHGHYDHVGAVDAVCGHFGIPLHLHPADLPKLTNPDLNAGALFGKRVTVRTPAQPIQEGEVLSLGGMDVTVWSTPGHSKGSCCFLLPQDQGVLCGDTLFNGGYGRTDFADGDFGELKQSLRRLFLMEPRQLAYPGHGPSTFVGRKPPEEPA